MIFCGRCGQMKDNAEINHGLMVTSGCYDVSGPPWDKFRRSGELVICDECMWDDALYIEIYGSRR